MRYRGGQRHDAKRAIAKYAVGPARQGRLLGRAQRRLDHHRGRPRARRSHRPAGRHQRAEHRRRARRTHQHRARRLRRQRAQRVLRAGRAAGRADPEQHQPRRRGDRGRRRQRQRRPHHPPRGRGPDQPLPGARGGAGHRGRRLGQDRSSRLRPHQRAQRRLRPGHRLGGQRTPTWPSSSAPASGCTEPSPELGRQQRLVGRDHRVGELPDRVHVAAWPTCSGRSSARAGCARAGARSRRAR